MEAEQNFILQSFLHRHRTNPLSPHSSSSPWDPWEQQPLMCGSHIIFLTERPGAQSTRKGRGKASQSHTKDSSRGNLPKGAFKNHRKRFMFSLCNVAFPPFQINAVNNSVLTISKHTLRSHLPSTYPGRSSQECTPRSWVAMPRWRPSSSSVSCAETLLNILPLFFYPNIPAAARRTFLSQWEGHVARRHFVTGGVPRS